jgi:hypothetical protein
VHGSGVGYLMRTERPRHERCTPSAFGCKPVWIYPSAPPFDLWRPGEGPRVPHRATSRQDQEQAGPVHPTKFGFELISESANGKQ